MTNEPENIDMQTATELLAQAEQAANTMVSTGSSTRYFLLAWAIVGSTVLSLENVISGTAKLWIVSLFVLLALGQYLYARNKTKTRPLLGGSAAYAGYAFLALLAVMCLRMWIADDLWSIGAKWIITCYVLWELLSGAQKAWDKDRVQDSQERAV